MQSCSGSISLKDENFAFGPRKYMGKKMCARMDMSFINVFFKTTKFNMKIIIHNIQLQSLQYACSKNGAKILNEQVSKMLVDRRNHTHYMEMRFILFRFNDGHTHFVVLL